MNYTELQKVHELEELHVLLNYKKKKSATWLLTNPSLQLTRTTPKQDEDDDSDWHGMAGRDTINSGKWD